MTSRAGGWVLCETGWELDTSGPPSTEHVMAVEDELDGDLTETEQEEEQSQVESLVLLEPEREPVELEPAQTVNFGRSVCPDCGKNVAVNRDGSLRKHRCEEE